MPARRQKLARYKSLLNEFSTQILSPIDPLSDIPSPNRYSRLKSSTVFNTLWTADEKNRFFTALARCGKGNINEVARRVGTKSLVEVTAYVGLLDEETEQARDKKARHRYRVYDLAKVPAAVEVDDEWLEVEEECASRIAVQEDKSDVEKDDEEEELDEDEIFDVEQANDLATWHLYASMFGHRSYPSKLSADTIRNLDNLARSITKQLVQTILTLIAPPHFVQSAIPSRNVSVSDVRTAVDILSLPRYYRAHFSGLPSRLGVRVVGLDKSHHRAYIEEFGEDGTVEEVADYILKKKTSIVSRERTRTVKPWPAKWSPHEGFDWAKESFDGTVETKQEGDLEVSSQSTIDDSEPMDEGPPETDNSEETFSTYDDNEEYHELWLQPTNSDMRLLDFETAYLEALDTQYSQIEHQRLHLRLSKGRKESKRLHKAALRSFTPSKETLHKKIEWEKARKQLRLKFGNQWAVHEDEIVGVEGEGWERPPEEWELWKKRMDCIEVDNVEAKGIETLLDVNDGTRHAGRKRKIEEEEEEEEDESDFSE